MEDRTYYEKDSFHLQLQGGQTTAKEELAAKHVYLLMKSDYRISRNVRAQWFFSRLNREVRIGRHDNIDDFEEEICVLSVIPCDPAPSHWSPETARDFTYRLQPSTTITYLAQNYKLVFCIDLSPSVVVVDVNSGDVVLDRMSIALRKCFESLVCQFVVPGSCLLFSPNVYVTVIAHSSLLIYPNQQVVVQGWLLTAANLQEFLSLVQSRLNVVEDCLARCSSSLQQRTKPHYNNNNDNCSFSPKLQVSSERSFDCVGSDDAVPGKVSPDSCFINLLRYGILALQLLPDNTIAGIVVVTDGVINVPDIHIFQSLLAQLRNSTISCSFLHVTGSQHPSCCWGYASFPDLMRFIATATYGAYLPNIPDKRWHDDSTAMNAYHQGLLAWSFQWASYADKVGEQNLAVVNRDTAFDNCSFALKEDFHVETKKHVEKIIATSLETILSCRLREGYGIQEISVTDGNRLEVSLLLPWKHDVSINYVMSSSWPLETASCQYKVLVRGSYEFLHDLTCPTKKPIKSIYRSNVVKKFFEALQQLSQTDDVLVHLHSFASNSAYYVIPESIRNGVPLFYLASGSTRPVLCSSDFSCPKFAEFWEPICMLDINIWQKWMHTHRIGIILAHDRPLPKYLHVPSSNGRYNTVQCRQALASLNKLLAEWSSFVLVENHTYIRLVYAEQDKPPISFYIIRVISQAPCMVIRLAFLGGMPSQDRNEIVNELQIKILELTSPSRANLKTTAVGSKLALEAEFLSDVGTGGSQSSALNVDPRTKCCVQLLKPVEKFLIRYERTPVDYANIVVPSRGFPHFGNLVRRKMSSMFSTLGRYLYHRRWVWSAQCNGASAISLLAVSRVLSTLIKMRLQKGFHLAHSYCGIINMVLEIEMQAAADGCGVTQPCVLQYVLFPPHFASALRESMSDEEPEPDLSSGETEGELQLVIECWVEPQHGFVAKGTLGSQDLEGMTFEQLPEALFCVDRECISTLLTFEHLNVMCKRLDSLTPDPCPPLKESPDPSIKHIGFPYDLTTLLAKCPQAQFIFSTLAQGYDTSPDDLVENDVANNLLLSLIHDGILSVHDREVPLSSAESNALGHILRRKLQPVGPSRSLPTTLEDDASSPKWNCYIKGLSSTHVLLTFVPNTFQDLLLLDRSLFKHDAELVEMECASQLHGHHFSLPIYAVDCSLSALILTIVGSRNSRNGAHVDDFFQDYRPSRCLVEDVVTVCSSDESSKLTSPEPRTEDSDASQSSGRLYWKPHSNCLAMIYSSCFVTAIYQCLQKGIPVYCSDIQSSMEEICIETTLEIDITEFLKTVCLHVTTASSSRNDQRMLNNAIFSDSTKNKRVNLCELTVPSNLDSMGPCAAHGQIHVIVQSKFASIMKQNFTPVDSNPDYYYYNPFSFPRAKSSMSDGLDEFKDEDCDTVQLRLASGPGDVHEARYSVGTDVGSEDYYIHPSISSADGASVMQEIHSENDVNEDVSPLFIHLTCSVSDRRNQRVANCSLQSLPTCFGKLKSCTSELGWLAGERIDLTNIRITLDVLCLTLPPETEAVIGQKETQLRTTSFCSSSPVALDFGIRSTSDDDEPYPTAGCDLEANKDPLGHLPSCQRVAVNTCVDEIKWMLRDEIASFARESHPISEAILESIANHVRESPGRNGCYASYVPLHFVFGPESSLDKFEQEFRHMSLRGYRLLYEGSYYYVALKGSDLADEGNAASVGLTNKHMVVQQRNPHQDDGAELDVLEGGRLASSCDHRRRSFGHPKIREIRSECLASSCEGGEDGGAISDGHRDPIWGRRLTSRSRTSGNRSKSESDLGNCNVRGPLASRARLKHQPKRSSFREESYDDNSEGLVRGVDAVDAQNSSTEDGYDGDSSDADDDGDLLRDSDTKEPQLPDFWLIMQVSADRVDIYFQFRVAEHDGESLQRHRDVNRQLTSNIKNICKVVNQALLLQDLHESRMCNQLLEPEANEDIWRQEEFPSALTTSSSGRRWSCWLPSNGIDDSEEMIDCQDTYLEATMKFMPGAFTCPVIWETQFFLHPRIKAGHGRMSISRGVQALKSVLSPLSVNNRKNMFVYKERTRGAVFYLRLHEASCAGANVGNEPLNLSVARQGVADELASLGGSRSSSLQSLNVVRNPLDTTDEFPEPRSRVNSMPEKDRDPSQDSVSVTSRMSGRQRCLEDVITLSVHGITEAGPEIKEDLVKALQNRLDDAILDVISITLARNPMCKLTPEDVQFIQKPNATPSAIRHFTVQPQMLPHLQVIVYYLRQNLLQFLNVPKYLDSHVENHFQRYEYDVAVGESEPPAVFLYVMPQEAGSRGVACIVLSVVDGGNNQVRHLDCPLPNPDAYKDGLETHEFEDLTRTSLYMVLDKDQKKTPGPLALIQVQIWEKGKIDLEQLVDRLGVAVRHALWDVVTEYRLLTAPLSEMLPTDEVVICSEPTTPVKINQQISRQDWAKGLKGRERIVSPLFLVQAKIRQMSTSVPDLMLKCRSPTWSCRGEFVMPFGIQPVSPTPLGSPSTAEEEVHIGMDAEVLRRREKYEVGEKGVLHKLYAHVAEQWLEFAKQTGVPSVQKHSLTLTSRHSVHLVIHEMSKLIANLVPDTVPRTFKKVVDFVPFHSFSISRDRRKASGSSFVEMPKFVPGKGNTFLVIGRNVRQWRASSGRLEDVSEVVDNKNIKDLQWFAPYFQSPEEKVGADEIVKKEPVFIPRQRLLLAVVRDCEIFLYLYNWAHDLANSLIDESSKLVEIQNMRSCFLSSVVFQKLGLFLNQPVSRKGVGACKIPGVESKLGKCIESGDLDLLLKSSGNSGMRRETGYLTSNRQRRSQAGHHHQIPFSDVLRDAKPQRPLHAFVGDPVFRHGQQFLEIRNADNRELQKQLVSMWQNREGRICANRLKQNSRVEHYCFTPILFHPVWRLQLAAARDHTRSCSPVNLFSASAVNLFHHQIELSTSGMRSRHSSGTSVKCSEAKSSRKSNCASGALAVLPKIVSESEKWHTHMYNAYIAEFVQYLQTLGFVGFRFPRKRPQQAKPEVSNTDERECGSGECAPRYLQKFLLGGILLLELVLCEPYFGVKMYTLESMRLRALSNRVLNSQFVVAFLDECDKIKVCMHLHSFTYDYHLRSIHSYISGRQLALRQYYHIVNFLDDFIQYYQKSPNFARNLVHQGSMTIGPTTSSTKQLFEYLLKFDRTYEMRAIKMVGHEATDEAEYALVQMSTHKVAYRDSSDTRQMDEFDVSLLIALDSLRAEVGMLCLKYCIILTSCREMYPKPVAEKQPGTFRTVVTTTLSPSRPPSRQRSRCGSLEQTDDGEPSDSSQVAGDLAQRSVDSRGDPNASELTDTLGSTSSECEKDVVPLELGKRMFGIRQEVVNYLGYFSSHEELMHKIIMEQVEEAKCHIDASVKRAMVDCRRDSLWERLQRGVRELEDGRRRKEDFREHHCMTYLEFMDLLSLVSRKPLTDIDSRLATFAVMPINWYQTLVKVLLNKYQDRHHHFMASDGNTQHVAILVGNPSNWFVLLSIDLHSNSSELCVVCREPATDWNPAIYALVEDIVNACCFHMWSLIL